MRGVVADAMAQNVAAGLSVGEAPKYLALGDAVCGTRRLQGSVGVVPERLPSRRRPVALRPTHFHVTGVNESSNLVVQQFCRDLESR